MKSIPTLLCLFLFAVNSLGVWGEDLFIHRSGNRFYRGNDSTPYLYKGVSFQYAPLQSGLPRKEDRHRLCAQLDSLQSVGVTNLRILAGVRGSIPDSLQGDSLLRGMDYLLKEMHHRNQVAVICFPSPTDSAWLTSSSSIADSLQICYQGWLERVVKHVNHHTRKAYGEDPTIMAWQLGENLRPASPTGGDALFARVRQTVQYLRTLDSRHMITVGSEGIRGSGNNVQLYRRLHSLSQVDYLTLQFRPIAWNWSSKSAVFTALSRVYNKSSEYLAEHERIAFHLNKPLVIESVTYPHDVGLAQSASGTRARDAYFSFVFSWLTSNRPAETSLCGVRVGEWDANPQPSVDYSVCDEVIRSTDSATLQTIRSVRW